MEDNGAFINVVMWLTKFVAAKKRDNIEELILESRTVTDLVQEIERFGTGLTRAELELAIYDVSIRYVVMKIMPDGNNLFC